MKRRLVRLMAAVLAAGSLKIPATDYRTEA